MNVTSVPMAYYWNLGPKNPIEVTIREATAEQVRFGGFFKRDREHVSLSPDLYKMLGISLYRTVRIKLSTEEGQERLMTAETPYSEEDPFTIRMTQTGLEKFFGSDYTGPTPTFPQKATITTNLFEASKAEAIAKGSIYAELITYGSGNDAFINAIHGGNIEVGTAEQAIRCAERLYNTYGYGVTVLNVWGYRAGLQTAYDRWHITAIDVGKSYPIPNPDFSPVVGLGFHGFNPPPDDDILVGGNVVLAQREVLRDQLITATGLIAVTGDVPDHLDGDAPNNVTNRYGGEGYQLETDFPFRNDPVERDLIADTCADFLASRLNEIGPFNPRTSITWHSLFWAEGSQFTALGLSDTAAVSTWPNETSEADAVQAIGANQPTYDASNVSFNNQPVIDFTPGSSGQLLQTAAFNSALDYTNGVSVIIIGKVDSLSGIKVYFDNTTTPNIGVYTANNKWAMDGGGAFLQEVGTSVTTSPHMVVAFFSGGNALNEWLTADGVTFIGPTSGGTGQLSGVTIGATYDNAESARLDGQVALFGIYEGDFTADAKYTDFTAWVQSHYGITIV